MPQFTVHRNPEARSQKSVPLLLDVQTDLLNDLQTRVVIPLYPSETSLIKPLTRLTPELTVEGKKYIMVTPELAGIPLRALGEPVADLATDRSVIIAALDLLISGF